MNKLIGVETGRPQESAQSERKSTHVMVISKL
ncbi:hypothetical protein ACVWXS_002828 [Lysinibacillus sp. TE18511]